MNVLLKLKRRRRHSHPRATEGRPALLRRVRKFLGFTQRRMAFAMNCSQVTVAQWETGTAPMPDHRLDSLLLLVIEAPQDDKVTPQLIHALREERGR